MPSPKLTCEFCSNEFRRDELGNHVRAKHMKEVAQMMLREYQTGVRITPIIQYATGRDLKNIPVVSEHLNGTYWFGVRPRFFCDSESYQTYLTEQNLAFHEAFLRECFDSITLLDWFIVGRQLSVQSPEMGSLKLQAMKDRKENEETTVRLKEAEQRIRFLECKLADAREEIDEKGADSIAHQELLRYKCLYEEANKETKRMKEVCDRYDEITASRIQQIYDDNLSARREMEAQMMVIMDQNQALKARNAREKDREVKKDMDKEKKEKEKRKKEKEERKAKEMEKLVRMMAKKMTAQDSDSESDSE